jgi:hypothetical protein
MKKNTKLVLIALLAVSAVSLCAQTNSPALPASTYDGLALSKDALWGYAISAISPIIVWLFTKLAPKIPKPVLPTITPLVGIGIGLGLNALAGTNLGWVDMAKAGALAVFIRETINQLITKQLNGEAAAEKASQTPPPPASPSV